MGSVGAGGGPANTRFFGRVEQVDAVRRALATSGCLVTLLGPGGAGKTRLAGQLEHSGQLRIPVGGFIAVSLQDSADLDEARIAVARGLAMEQGDPDEITEAIAARGPCLVVLDGVEHLLPDLADTLQRWRQGAPDARFLVTSQVRLGLAGERPIAVGPLAPAEAQELLLDRVEAVVPGFVASPADVAAAQTVVSALDGLPLALELAAARAAVLPLPQLAERLVAGLAGLGTGPRSLPARHATLAAAVRWSWDLLDDTDRAALTRCSAIDGDFGLDLAEAVLGSEAIDRLAAFTDRSLVLVSEASTRRFRLLRPLREHARTRLEDPEAVQGAIARWAGAGARAALEALQGAHPERGLDWVRAEERHLGAAVRYGAPDDAQAAARALAELSLRQGPVIAGLRSLDAAAQRAPERPEATLARARVLLALGRHDAARAALETVPEAAPSLHLQALLAVGRGRIRDARDLAVAAREAARTPSEQAGATLTLARLQWRRGKRAEATDLGHEALRVAEDAGVALLQAEIEAWLGDVAARAGRTAEATRLLEAASRRLATQGDRRGRLAALWAMARLAMNQGDADAAQTQLEGALALARELGEAGPEAELLLDLAGLDLTSEAPSIDALDAARRARRPDLVGRAQIDLALLARAGDRVSEALEQAEAALRSAESTGDTGARVEAGSLLAALQADSGRLVRALATQQVADGLLEQTTLTRMPARVIVLRAFLDLAGDDASAAASRLTEAAALAASELGSVGRTGRVAEPRLGAVLQLLAPRIPKEQWLAAWGRIVDPTGRRLVVTADGQNVRAPGGTWRTLGAGSQSARLLAALVGLKLRAPEAQLSTEEVVTALWPDERMAWQSALDRVHQAVRRLRKPLGADLVERLPDGYRLLVEPALVVSA